MNVTMTVVLNGWPSGALHKALNAPITADGQALDSLNPFVYTANLTADRLDVEGFLLGIPEGSWGMSAAVVTLAEPNGHLTIIRAGNGGAFA